MSKIKEDVKKSTKDFSALDNAILALDKRHGKGKIKNEDQLLEQVERWVLESPYLNYITGGGLPKGKMLEFIGPESSGKTSLSEIIAGDVQRQGGFVLFVDLEKAFEKKRALNLGMDLSKDKFLLVDPYTAEESMDMVETLIKSGMIDLVIIDSVAAMSPEVEQNGDFGDSNMGVHARLMSQSCRKLVSLVAAQNTTIIWINQIRMKIGVMFGCLHADTLINFEDGNSLPIRQIVDNKIKGKVWSYNDKNNKFETKEIIDWHHNGEVKTEEDYIHIQTEALHSLGEKFDITVTPNHKILTKLGWKEARNITKNDEILSKYESVMNGVLGIKEAYVKPVLIKKASKRQLKQKGKYDLTIKDNSNYIAGGINNGIIVHNSPETTPGGKALKFYSSIRLDVRIMEKIFGKDKDDVLGNKIRIKSIKNKTASPFKKAEIFLYFNKGFDVYSQYIDFAIAYKLIDKAGSWYSYKTEKIGQGKEKVKEFLLENPKVYDTIKKQVNQLILNKSSQDDDEILNDNVEENNV